MLGVLILVMVGALLYRAFRLGSPSVPRIKGLVHLRPDLHAVYHPVAQEVERQTAMLAVSLNDAFDERDVGRHDMAWRMVGLSASEWGRVAELVTALLNTLSAFVTSAHAVVPVRAVAVDEFKSRVMIDHSRMHELLDKLLYSSQRRFQLQIRLLLGATATLTAEFRRTRRYGEHTQDPSPEVWSRLDHYFHDFDLVAKEALLAFRGLLVCLPPEAISELTAELRTLVPRGARTSVTTSIH